MVVRIDTRARTDGKTQTVRLDFGRNRTPRYETLKGLILTGNKRHDKEIMELAENARIEAEERWLNERYNGERKRTKLTLSQWIDEYKEGRPRAAANYATIAEAVKDFGDIPLTDVSVEWCDSFRRWLVVSRKIGGGTFRSYWGYIRAAIKAAKRKRFCSVDLEMVEVLKVRQPKPKEELTESELKQLEKAFRGREPKTFAELEEKALEAFFFGCYTGLRYSDIKTCKIVEGEGGMFADGVTIKTNERYHVPLCENALRYLIVVERREIPSPTTANRAVHKLCKLVGLEKYVTFHTSRHTFASILANNGVDVGVLQSLLNHTDVRTTKRYYKVLENTQRKAVEVLTKISIEQ